MNFDGQQAEALKAVGKWIKTPRSQKSQIFRLFGYAGSGKTTIAKELAAMVDGAVPFCAFTGKAALVLGKKGCLPSSTIHSAIYKVDEDEETGEVEFKLNPDSEISTASMIIVDEVSMVGPDIGQDLMSYGVPILVLGDPAQLPPIKGAGFFTQADPDFMLTEIHRQAADNPIIRMSMDVREGRKLALGYYGDSKIITRDQVDRDEVMTADQILVGRNTTRRAYNARMRELRGRQTVYPVKGDRMICLKNNKTRGLLNGGLWEVATTPQFVGAKDKRVKMGVLSLDEHMKVPLDIEVPVQFFTGKEDELDWKVKKKHDEFDYGYAITVHKSQGSQWDNVFLFDESKIFRETSMNHLYTGITRAAERITIVI